MTDYISREAALDVLCKASVPTFNLAGKPILDVDYVSAINSIPAADVREVPSGGIGEMSDGYHTFNGLYYQRMILFSALVRAYRDRAWKSYKHEDGELCFGGGWFIVGIDTPQGSYTYHYESKDFDLFDCVELPIAPHWDGHTEKDVTRLLSLPDVREVVLCKDCVHYVRGELFGDMVCDYYLHHYHAEPNEFCSHAEKREEQT